MIKATKRKEDKFDSDKGEEKIPVWPTCDILPCSSYSYYTLEPFEKDLLWLFFETDQSWGERDWPEIVAWFQSKRGWNYLGRLSFQRRVKLRTYENHISSLTTILGKTSNTILRILSVKGGGGVPPKSITPFLPKILSVKGGGGVPPISVTYFLDQNQVFLIKKTQFLALF